MALFCLRSPAKMPAPAKKPPPSNCARIADQPIGKSVNPCAMPFNAPEMIAPMPLVFNAGMFSKTAGKMK